LARHNHGAHCLGIQQEEAMSYLRNQVSKGMKTLKKKSHKKEQLQNVISLRINDEEKKELEKLTKSTSKSVSEIMREAINLWSAKRRKLCLD
jgi:alkaline phosphatase